MSVRPSASNGNSAGIGELLQLLRDGRPRTRAELASITGLARSTVAGRVETLIELGLVTPVGEAVSTGGRPPSQFAINPTSRLVVGVDVGARHAVVAIADLNGSVMDQRRTSVDIAEGPTYILQWVIDAATQVLASLNRAASEVIGMGIGVPGPVEHTTGRPSNPPIMPGWDGFDIPAWVHERLPVPVFVDNDVNIMALGERRFAWPSANDLMFVKVATGIGSGIISGGSLQRGAQGTAGDLGHVQVTKDPSVVCRCGNTGCLEAVAAGPAIARLLRDHGLHAETSADVVEYVRAGDTTATQLVRQAGRTIGEVLAMCVNLINPSVIAIGGAMSDAGENLMAGIREVVYARSMPLATRQLVIAKSRAGRDAGVIGAAILAIENALTPNGLDPRR